jgi:aminopeptidase
MSTDFSSRFERYAELAVKAWLNVQPGQRLVIVSPLEGAPLARAISKHAYQNGSPFVHLMWNDSEATRLRYRYAPRDSWNEYPEELLLVAQRAVERGDALLSITAQDPDLLRGLDMDFVSRAQKTAAEKNKALLDAVRRSQISWLGIGMPVPAWAQRVFPDVSADDAVAQLWDAIFRVCRVDEPDPVAAWQAHAADLNARCAVLNQKQFSALHYFGGETDLTVGLPQDHVWVGVTDTTQSGITFIANAPTEEIFTMPHRNRVNGVVTSTKPLPVRGNVIAKFSLTFESGRVVQVRAAEHQAILENLIATDEGAARLGEVALVPHSSPLSKSGLLFYNPLFDENAASHLALGTSYPQCVRGGTTMTNEELAARGANDSLVHLDFMVGSEHIHIDGIYANGKRESVMRAGEWAFSL